MTDTNQASEDEKLARLFHDTYERLAPAFSYKTRKASAVPWAEVPPNNKGLMIAVAHAVNALTRTEKLKLLAEIGEPKLEDAINEEKTPEGVKSTPKEPNDIFIILSPYFECKDCGELGCPYNPDVPAELAEAIDQYTQSKLKAFAGEVEEAIGEDLSVGDEIEENRSYTGERIYNKRNEELRESLKAIKERWNI